ncbi:Ectoine hydroxylase-related dioxygenase, phytanoyl-CoA dioxygenase (PhyH) family [Noviherbaspirillum humi]|uniref:Ectoine hydroxylase-related dioxygenase, phytanoyl-CoA dioxygenase (PhyH) family n=1 Tax=Noviherbaspirillum humi TaxID=1688639 RepID=A0A239G013_9BURK|nr:phytanoyl-CoA dioxygenase family protein [Noviherbaspirillum humi]SNS61872.1 Ectoine hydroxylase-related dioxygenase, phytanoyl-CoA dioxygenase (PhyH) family [Noviherbaspirillum humi]
MKFLSVSESDFLYEMAVNGACVVEHAVDPGLCERMKEDAHWYYRQMRPVQIAAGLEEISQWSAHHTCGRHDGIHAFLDSAVIEPYISAYFGNKPFILNTIGTAINPPIAETGRYEHGHKWHRDIRTYNGNDARQLLIALVLLDPFTIDNGATEVLFGTHHHADFPPANFIERFKRTMTAPRGSVLFMDGDVWHRAGQNHSNAFRIGLSCVFTRPYRKQQMDYPRYLPESYASSLSPGMRQLFGFNARMPASIDEWYQLSENRFYKSDQG